MIEDVPDLVAAEREEPGHRPGAHAAAPAVDQQAALRLSAMRLDSTCRDPNHIETVLHTFSIRVVYCDLRIYDAL